ncbi:MAG: hypothetical protein IJE46_03660 [Clostridia bacterium]|nr:hypothetical protein [Clostridia bacterium]
MDSNAMNLFSSLLSNPDAMKNIKDIIGNVDSGNKNEEISEQNNLNSFQPKNDLNFLNDILSQSKNNDLLRKVNNAYNVYSNNSTPGIKLLEALAPYLSSKRVNNLEKVKTVIKMTNAVSEFNKK